MTDPIGVCIDPRSITPVDGDGLINPPTFPVKTDDLKVADIEASAASLVTIGDTVNTNMGEIDAAWQALGGDGVYVAPEQGEVLAVMAPAVTDAGELRGALKAASDAIDTYAGEVQTVKGLLATFTTTAESFRREALAGYSVPLSVYSPLTAAQEGYWTGVAINGGEEQQVPISWKEHTPAVERNAELLTEYAGLYSQLSTAAANCANTINGLLTNVCAAPVEPVSVDVLLSSSGWGPPTAEDRSCEEQVGDGIVNFGVNTVTGAASLIGRDPNTGEWSWGNAGNAWLGVGDFALSTVVLAATANPITNWTVSKIPGVNGWVEDRQNVAITGWGGIIGYDHQEALAGGNGWHKYADGNWAATLTESVLNVGTAFIPVAGATGAGARVATAGSRAGLAARAGSVIRNGAEMVLPGLSHVVNKVPQVVNFVANKVMPSNLKPVTVHLDALDPPTTPRTGTGPSGATPTNPGGVTNTTHTPISNPGGSRPSPELPTSATPSVEAPSVTRPADVDASTQPATAPKPSSSEPSAAAQPVRPDGGDAPASRTDDGRTTPTPRVDDGDVPASKADETETPASRPTSPEASTDAATDALDEVPADVDGPATRPGDDAQHSTAPVDTPETSTNPNADSSDAVDLDALADYIDNIPDISDGNDFGVQTTNRPYVTGDPVVQWDPPQANHEVTIDRLGPRTTFPPKGLELEPNTAYSVPDRGVYTTNADGVVTHVDAVTDRTQGAPLNWDLQHPMPDVTYRVTDTGGSVAPNGEPRRTTYVTDEFGRTETMVVENPHFDDQSGRSEGTQSRVGREGDITVLDENGNPVKDPITKKDKIDRHYQGGHAHAREGGGIREYVNYWPMLEELNTNNFGNPDTIRDMEIAFREMVENDKTADYVFRIDARFDPLIQAMARIDSRVPTSFHVTITKNGISSTLEFNNVRP